MSPFLLSQKGTRVGVPVDSICCSSAGKSSLKVFIDGKSVSNQVVKDEIIALPDSKFGEGSNAKIVMSWTEEVAP